MKENPKTTYRKKSVRAAWWDYGWDHAYFVTICTHGRAPWFGKVIEGQMQLSQEGNQAQAIWEMIPAQFPYAQLDAFVIMPNHMHGIVVIEHPQRGADADADAMNRVSAEGDGTDDAGDGTRDAMNRVSTGGTKTGGITGQDNPMLHDNLSRIIRWYKGRTTYECRKINPVFRWQARFWDRIIRNGEEWARIAHYIQANPANWAKDEHFLS